MNALDILNIAENKDLTNLEGAYSDFGEQIKTGYAVDTGMEGGFGTSEKLKLSGEYNKARSDMAQNYALKRKYILEKEKQAKEAREKQKWGNILKGAGGLISGASMFLGPAGALIGGAVGQGMSAAGDFTTGQQIDIDWNDFNNRWKSWRKNG